MTGGATLERPLVVVGYTTDDVCLACLAGGRNSVKVKKSCFMQKKGNISVLRQDHLNPSFKKTTLEIGLTERHFEPFIKLSLTI